MLKNKKNNFTAKELALLQKVDAVLELSPKHDIATNGIPAFVDKFNLLREKRSQAGTQSVVKHQANKLKTDVVSDTTAVKDALAAFVSNALGHFKEYAKEENDANLKKGLSDLTSSNLKRLKPFDLVTNLRSFAETVKTLNADRLVYHGLDADWHTTLSEKVSHYDSVLPQKATLKSDKPVETTNFKAIIKEINDIVTSLNNLIGGYQTKNQEFYDNYIRVAGIKIASAKRSKKSTKTKQAAVNTLMPKVKKERKSRKKQTTDKLVVTESTPVADNNEATSVPAAASEVSAASMKS
jgi:hypothetical protein